MNGDLNLRSVLGRRSDWLRLRRPSFSLKPRGAVGGLLVVVSLGVSWIPFAAMTSTGDDPLGLYLGTLAIILMAWSFLLSVRTRVVEKLFDGLDRVYVWHRWIGMLSILAMWLHIQQTNEVAGVLTRSKRALSEVGTSLAGLAEIVFYVLVIMSVVRWVPYRWWRQTHKLLGVPYLFACFHFLTAEKPYANLSGWGIWFALIMLVGTVAWITRVVGRDMIRPGIRYTISAITASDTATEVTLTPATSKKLHRRAGQFAFIKVQAPGMSEPHPFSIASPPHHPDLRFLLRRRGDWTDVAPASLAIGHTVIVEGPYGSLRLRPRDARPVVWFAGGIGITPFLSAIAEYPTQGRVPGGEPTVPHLFYSVSTRSDAMALDELLAADREGRVHLHLQVSRDGSRLTESAISAALGDEGMRGAHVVVCGPDGYADDVRLWSAALGSRSTELETFDIRSGIAPDLSRPLARITDRWRWVRAMRDWSGWLRRIRATDPSIPDRTPQ